MEAPETRYALNGDVSIAYQVVGSGPVDLVLVPTWFNNVDLLWEQPAVSRFFERLASFSRLVMFDRRGTGLSDPVTDVPGLEEQMDDVNAVMDAAGVERAAVMGQLEGGAMSALFAASHPERVSHLVLYATFARVVSGPGYEWAPTREDRNERVADFFAHWGTGERISLFAPSLDGDEAMRRWMGRFERGSAPPAVMRPFIEAMGDLDVRDVLPSIRVPTLVLQRAHDQFLDMRHAEYLAEHIPDARLVKLPGRDNLIISGDTEALLDEVEEFVTGARPSSREPDRALATVMFTDIVGGTERAAEMGDRRWRDLLESHYGVIRNQIDRFQGREVKTMGDGFLATFDGPARAIRCATASTDAVHSLGLDIRAGLHTGEVEVMGDDLGGIAVHIGARVGARAEAGEVLVSGTVKDLVVGSGFEFAERGTHELKGVPGEWRLFAVER
ncbi:MAG TPA: adenylate/guanylate cyclase domain-containing protein [Acidimicrobiia bacterium]|jgi:class 3 adenylate cyclase|nr:adenylate/guanylate cyclase domain-containing protein [Acidimicrobiia bacterium]